MFANEPTYGMSSCAPIHNITSNSIYATTCIDIRATGELSDFFVLSEQDNFYLLLNEDEQLSHDASAKLGIKFGN